MSFRNAMEEAFQRGEKFKEQFLTDMLSSPAVNNLLQNEVFLKSLTKVLNTKYELKRAVKTNFKSMLKTFNVPSRDEVHSLERKLTRMETEIDGIHRKIVTTRLSEVKSKKQSATKKKSKASRRKSSAKPKASRSKS